MKRVIRMTILLGLLVALSSGCMTAVFTEPTTLSTKSLIAKHVTPIKPVSVKRSDYLFVIIPVVHDPRSGFDDLLDEAKAAGGDCVIDFQVRDEPGFLWMLPPIMVHNYVYTGTAARMEK